MIFYYASDLGLNSLFYLTDNISDKYHYTGVNRLLYTLINNLIISLVSAIFSFTLSSFFDKLSHSTNKINKLFNVQDNLLKTNKKYKVNKKTKNEIIKNIEIILKCLKIKIKNIFNYGIIIYVIFLLLCNCFLPCI